MAGSTSLLDNLLRSLVDHWGHHNVELALRRVSSSDDPNSTASISRSGDANKSKTKKKQSAEDIARRTPTTPPRKLLLVQIAKAFDEKRFLPTVGHVKNFLLMRAKSVSLSSTRANTFRPLLEILLELEEDELRQILESEAHEGPAKLAPLSDAIGNATRKIRHDEP